MISNRFVCLSGSVSGVDVDAAVDALVDSCIGSCCVEHYSVVYLDDRNHKNYAFDTYVGVKCTALREVLSATDADFRGQPRLR